MTRGIHHDAGAVGDDPPAALVASLPDRFVVRMARAGAVPDQLTATDRAEAATGIEERLATFTLGRSLTRLVAASVLGVEAADVPLGREDRGKPILRGTSWHLSVSHTRTDAGDLAVVVLAPVAVGLDVEPVRPRGAGLAARILADGEALPEWTPDTSASIIAAWTAKEASLKADGIGLWQGAKAARLVWGADGTFTADTPAGRWQGQTILHDGLAWSLAWAASSF